jgi:hypothetical protein
MDTTISTILIVLAILIVVFLILREVNCWYWKINERISILNEQKLVLKEILSIIKPKLSEENVTLDQNVNNTKETLTDEELMNKYEIIFEADKYIYLDYKYDKLIDAVNYAKLVENKKNK